MMKKPELELLVASVALCVLIIAGASSADADSIYLKNGRVIHTASARIEGNQVIFVQFGSQQSIPLEIVDRVEVDNRVGPGHPARTSPPVAGQPSPSGQPSAGGAGATSGAGATAPPGGASPFPSGATMGTPAERMEALAAFFGENSDGAVDPQQALGVLQALGGLQGGAASGGGLESMMGMLGALGGMGAESGEGAVGGNDLAVIQQVLPQMAALAQALFAPEYDQENTQAAVADLMKALTAAGVSEAQIREMAAQWGLPAEWLRQQR